MIIIWGTAGSSLDLGSRERIHCRVCGTVRPFHLVLTYEYSHLYYVFGFVSRKEYVLCCGVCQDGVLLDSKEVETGLGYSPIPFLHRFGCLTGVILVLAFIIFMALVVGTTPLERRLRRSQDTHSRDRSVAWIAPCASELRVNSVDNPPSPQCTVESGLREPAVPLGGGGAREDKRAPPV